MLNSIIQFVVFAISTFILALGIRTGMSTAERFDAWLISKSESNFVGFNWFFRIPFNIGIVPEFFFRAVLGRDNYFKTNWWGLKISSFLAVLIFVALLKTRSGVANYYTLAFLGEKGVAAFFTSGVFVWYLNLITLTYLALLGIIIYESIKIAGVFAPARILYFGVLCLLMAAITIITLSVIIFITVVYLIYKIIGFLFFNQRKKYRNTDEIDLGGDKIRANYVIFKAELIDWETQLFRNKTYQNLIKTTRKKPKITRKKNKITESQSSSNYDNIPRFHPD